MRVANARSIDLQCRADFKTIVHSPALRCGCVARDRERRRTAPLETQLATSCLWNHCYKKDTHPRAGSIAKLFITGLNLASGHNGYFVLHKQLYKLKIDYDNFHFSRQNRFQESQRYNLEISTVFTIYHYLWGMFCYMRGAWLFKMPYTLLLKIKMGLRVTQI